MCSRGSDECAYLSEAVVIDEIRSVSVDQSVEGEAVLPAVTQRADVLSVMTRRTETQKDIWLLITVRSIWHVPVPPTGGDVSSQLQQLISGIVDIPGQHLSSCIHIHLTFISHVQQSTYIQSVFTIIWCPSWEKYPPLRFLPFLFSINVFFWGQTVSCRTDRPSGIGDLGIYKLNLTRLEQWAFNERKSVLALVDTTYQHVQLPLIFTCIRLHVIILLHDNWESLFSKILASLSFSFITLVSLESFKNPFFQPRDQELNPDGNSEYLWFSEKLISNKNTDDMS